MKAAQRIIVVTLTSALIALFRAWILMLTLGAIASKVGGADRLAISYVVAVLACIAADQLLHKPDFEEES